MKIQDCMVESITLKLWVVMYIQDYGSFLYYSNFIGCDSFCKLQVHMKVLLKFIFLFDANVGRQNQMLFTKEEKYLMNAKKPKLAAATSVSSLLTFVTLTIKCCIWQRTSVFRQSFKK